jgi:L-arabinonolactonase
MLRSVDVPARQPTCPAFGGEGLRQLMVTTARQQMSREALRHQPHSGSLFMLESLDVAGIADTLFNDE